jgi:prepilin-type N-terminal cleavage/methylation domain-containing protein
MTVKRHMPKGWARDAGRRAERSSRVKVAFTLIELLVVIAIIGILAAMILVVTNRAILAAKKSQTKIEISHLVLAIDQYESTYGHFPVSTAVQQSGWTNVTYGGVYNNSSGAQWPAAPAPVNYEPSNSEVISILLDVTNFPGNGAPTVNANHLKNSQQVPFLIGKLAGDTSSPGIGSDLNYRDPWGNPYIISIDLGANNTCEDAFYSSPQVSSTTQSPGGSGLDGLISQPDGTYAFHGNVMVWSMGPNGPANHSPSSFNAAALATDPSNKNHILSWQQ